MSDGNWVTLWARRRTTAYHVVLETDAAQNLHTSIAAIVAGVNMPVQGIDADDFPMTALPVAISGKYIAAPAGDTLDDGDAGYILLNNRRMPIVELGGYSAGVSLRIEGTVADDVATTAYPVVIGGKYIADPAANPIEDGDAGWMLLNSRRMPVVTLGTTIAGEDLNRDNLCVCPGGSFQLLNGAGTYTIKNSLGTLSRVIIHGPVAGSSLTIYDGPAALLVKILDTVSCTATELPGNVPHVIEVHANFATSCVVVIVGALKVTAIFR